MFPRDESDWNYNGPFSHLAEIHAFQLLFGVGFAVASPWDELTAAAAAVVGFETAMGNVPSPLLNEAREQAHYALMGLVSGSFAGIYAGRLARRRSA